MNGIARWNLGAEFGADEHANGPIEALGFFEGDADAVGVIVGFNEVVIYTPGVKDMLDKTAGGVWRGAAPGPAAVTNQQNQGWFRSRLRPRIESPASKTPVF